MEQFKWVDSDTLSTKYQHAVAFSDGCFPATGCDVRPSVENRGKRFLAVKTPRGFAERRELAQKSREREEKGRMWDRYESRRESLAIPAISSELARDPCMLSPSNVIICCFSFFWSFNFYTQTWISISFFLQNVFERTYNVYPSINRGWKDRK